MGFFLFFVFFTFAGVSFVYELLHSEHEVELTQSFFSESVCTVVSFFFHSIRQKQVLFYHLSSWSYSL